MKQRSACIIIKFEKEVNLEEEQKIVDSIYKNNKNRIDGMEYTGFDCIKPISIIKAFIKQTWNK